MTGLFEQAQRYHRAREFAEAERLYRAVLAKEPDHSAALAMLGLVMYQRGQLPQAAELMHRAAALAPDKPATLHNLCEVLRKLGRHAEAIETGRRAAALMPDSPDVRFNLANALRDAGQREEACARYQEALRLKPDHASAHFNLGQMRLEQGQFREAMESFRRAVAANPHHANALINLAGVAQRLGELAEAERAYLGAIDHEPAVSALHVNLAGVLMKQGRVPEALQSYRHALELRPADAIAHSGLLLGMNYLAECSPEAIFAESRRWNQVHAAPLARTTVTHCNGRDLSRRLRIGYVSADFADHPVSRWIGPVLAAHDRSAFELFCYSSTPVPDARTEELRRHADQWHEVLRLSDEQLAVMVRQHQIDILVDLSGHTAGNRLLAFARRPAPVQMSWLGYPATTGLDAIDYVLTDALLDPPGQTEQLHSERLLRLPDVHACFVPPADAPEVAALPMERAGYVTFGCFNNFAKVRYDIIETWAGLLRDLPGSRLLLKSSSAIDRALKDRLPEALTAYGVSRDRIEVHGRSDSYADHLRMYGRVDIALDTYPYCGATTTCEALHMGVPVVTLAGEARVSRMGLSLLTNLGLPQLVARSFEEYQRIAKQLAGDPRQLADLRAGLRQRLLASPLAQAQRFARQLETTYCEVWRAHCGGRVAATPG